MKKDEIFFGEQGLTTTSANHLANKAKEAYLALEQLLSLEDIAKAKLRYKAKYRRMGKQPRIKDVQDLEILHSLLLENQNIIWD